MRRALGWLGGTSLGPRAAVAICALAAAAAALRPVEPTSASNGAMPATDLGALARRDSGDALRRPVFDPERRPWTARGDRADVLGQDRASPTLVLRGVLVDGSARQALVDDGSGEAAWLREGEGRDGWRLLAIEPGRVVVADARRRYTVEFLGGPIRLQPAPRLQREAAAAAIALRPPLDDQPPR